MPNTCQELSRGLLFLRTYTFPPSVFSGAGLQTAQFPPDEELCTITEKALIAKILSLPEGRPQMKNSYVFISPRVSYPLSEI